MIVAVILAITETGEEGCVRGGAHQAGPAGDVDPGENTLEAVMTEPVSGQTVALAGLGGVEAEILAGIVVRGPRHTQSLGLDKATTTNVKHL